MKIKSQLNFHREAGNKTEAWGWGRKYRRSDA